MTIDEAIDIVNDLICYLHNSYVDYLKYGGEKDKEREDNIHALENIVQALVWYREHDLIDREDVLWVVKYNCDQPKKLMRVIEDMPKAEPPSEIKQELNETKNERNGDCETCLHVHSTSQICEKCDYGDRYEPYIP